MFVPIVIPIRTMTTRNVVPDSAHVRDQGDTVLLVVADKIVIVVPDPVGVRYRVPFLTYTVIHVSFVGCRRSDILTHR